MHEYLTITEAVKRIRCHYPDLHITKSKFKRWIKEGRISTVTFKQKVSFLTLIKVVLVDLGSVLKFVKSAKLHRQKFQI